jgi:hypothetical protein
MTNTNARTKMHAFFIATSSGRKLTESQLNPFSRSHFLSVADEINGCVDIGELILALQIGGDLLEYEWKNRWALPSAFSTEMKKGWRDSNEI